MNRISICSLSLAALCGASVSCGGDDTPPASTPIQRDASAPPPDKPSEAGAPTLDPQMLEVLTALDMLADKPVETLTHDAARKRPTISDAVRQVLQQKGKSAAPEPVAQVEDRTLLGPAMPLPVRIYTPSGDGPFPVLVYFHGGGWVIGSLDSHDATARALANLTGAVVVSADYRLGPEFKFPSAHDDAFAAYKWTRENVVSFNGDPSHIAVGGEGAGANLALNVAIRAHAEGVQMPVHQMLIYPIAGGDTNTPSYQENAKAKPLSRATMQWFFDRYLRGSTDMKDPMISLATSPNLKGLPSATVITAQMDPLRSEGRALADSLSNGGSEVEYVGYGGVTHDFFLTAAVVDKARDAQQKAALDLRKAFQRGASPL